MRCVDSIQTLPCPDKSKKYARSTSSELWHLPRVDCATPMGGVDNTPLPAEPQRDNVSDPLTICRYLPRLVGFQTLLRSSLD